MYHDLKRKCRHHLQNTFGVNDYRPGQKEAVFALLSGRDVMCNLPTGAGKSLCWQLPALVHEGLTVVVTPLITLMRDQVQHLRQAGVFAVSLDSLMSQQEYMRTVDCIRKGEVRIVFVSPERTEQRDFRILCSELKPWLVVIDEAHCVSRWGEEFRPAYLSIADFINMLPDRPVVCALTATADFAMQRRIASKLGMRRWKSVRLPYIRENLIYKIKTTLDVSGEVGRLCFQHTGKTIVFCRTRKYAEWLASDLKHKGIKSSYYHAGLERQERLEQEEKFLNGETDVLCSTTAFGMGVDIPDIRRAIHTYLPDSLIDYAQQSGRAGRDRAPAECILLFEPESLIINARNAMRSSKEKTGIVERQRSLHRFWRDQQLMLKTVLASRCIPEAIALGLGWRIPKCGKCSACMNDARIPNIPRFKYLNEQQLRLWFLKWQRDYIAKTTKCRPSAVLSDRALITASKTLEFPASEKVPDDLKRLIVYFRRQTLE